MRNIHEHYDQLSGLEKVVVDKAFTHTAYLMKANLIKHAMDDRAERLVDAIAKYILESKD